jgi:hypothetical protein
MKNLLRKKASRRRRLCRDGTSMTAEHIEPMWKAWLKHFGHNLSPDVPLDALPGEGRNTVGSFWSFMHADMEAAVTKP